MLTEVYCCSYVSTAWFTFSADLWSLGILMYELAIGKAPFGNNSDGQNRKEAEIIAFKGCLNLTSAGVANKADGCQTFGDLITKLLVWNPMFRIGTNMGQQCIDFGDPRVFHFLNLFRQVLKILRFIRFSTVSIGSS